MPLTRKEHRAWIAIVAVAYTIGAMTGCAVGERNGDIAVLAGLASGALMFFIWIAAEKMRDHHHGRRR